MASRQRFWVLRGGWPGRLVGLLAGAGWLLLGAAPARGQSPDSLAGIGARFRHYAGRTPTEKLFAHLDRPAYLSGETVWLRLYAVEGTTQRPLPLSTVAYVEVLDATGAPVVQAKISLRQAAGQGSLLLPAGLPTGRYAVRAYTSWMRNFSPDYFFRTIISVVNTHPAPEPATVAARPGASAAPALPAAAVEAQFFPEGGYLVQDVAGLVGVQATDATGRGLAAEGAVLDATGRRVAQFRTDRAGLASFSLTPRAGAGPYRAQVQLPGQPAASYPLPAVQTRGYGLHLEPTATGQLRVVVQTQGMPAAPLYLLAHAGQRVLLAQPVPLAGNRAELLLPASQLAPGVSHFTLFDGQRRPVAERLHFRAPTDTLIVQVRADQAQVASRQPVTLRLATAGLRPASLSVAVYQLDSLAAPGGPDIGSSLWLAADLPGPIRDARRYLRPGPEAAAAADNLLLTQGWRRFRWANVLTGRADSLPYPPELAGPLLRGRVVQATSKQPLPGVPVYVSAPGRRVQLYVGRSGPGGFFTLPTPDLYGSARLLVAQPDFQRDSLARVELFGAFAPPAAGGATGPLPLGEQLTASLTRRHAQAEVTRRFPAGPPGRYLPPAADTLAFYGKPSERYYLDRYTRFKVMEEVMREYVPGVLVRARRDGFHFLVPDYPNTATREDPLVLLDGLPVSTARIMAFDPLKVRRLDVQTTRYFLGPQLHNGLVSYSTYQGDLAGFEPDPRALLQEVEGLQGQREFYAPRYDTPAARQSRQPDFRNLLYWNPAVTTQPGQEAALTFYASDQAGRYRVVVQGLSDDGRPGSTSFEVTVKPSL